MTILGLSQPNIQVVYALKSIAEGSFFDERFSV